MPQTFISGATASSNILQAQRKVDMATDVAMKAPRVSPLMFLAQQPSMPYGVAEQGAKTVKFNTREVTNYEFDWLEDEIRTRADALNMAGNATSSDTVLTVDDADPFQVGDLVDVVATGEVLRVNQVDAVANTITVTRSWGATAAATISDNAVLLIIGNVNAENARSREASNIQKQRKTNYIQTTRHPFSGSQVLQNSDLYGGDQRMYDRKKFFLEHLYDIESSLLFSEKNIGTEYGGSNTEYSTSGLLELLSENGVAAGGTLSKSTFHTFLQGCFAYGSDEKFLFCSPTVANAITNFAGNDSSAPKSTVYVQNLANTFGLNIFTYVTKFGTVHIVMHGLLKDSVYSGYGICIDPQNLRMVHVRGGDKFSLYTDIQENDRAGWKDEYRTDFGLEYKVISTGGVLTGVTG